MHVGRDTSSIVGDRDRAVFVKTDKDVFGKTSNGFVERVIDDFDKQMMQSFFIGTTDIHSRAFANWLETF